MDKKKTTLTCVKCGGLLKKPTENTEVILGLVCDNETCDRFGLLSVVAKKITDSKE